MEYFAVQVWTGKEDAFAAALADAPDFEAGVFIPKRSLPLRRARKVTKVESAVFPGYAFVASEGPELSKRQRWALRRAKFFVRVLPSTSEPVPVKDKDRAILSHFMSFGKVADTSKVVFDDNDRIVVLEGPLKGLEGLIVKVDRRKCRARIRLALYEDSFPVDLAFEVIERAVKGPGTDDGKQP